MPIPKYDGLFTPTIEAIRRLGGSASIEELEDEVTRSLGLPEAELAQPHDERRTELQYRLAWARTYLKSVGYLDNSERGVWALTEKGRAARHVDPDEVKRAMQRQRGPAASKRRVIRDEGAPSEIATEAPDVVEAALADSWRDRLAMLLLGLPPAAFERLCQRLLRESGFVEVRVTGRSGDGGIDGVGIVRIGGLLGFPVLFQCKRYQGTVGAGVIRDFRGAMIGRADRGLVLTTGTFSREAKQEATRDGAPPIDLVDGEQLLDKLKELRLGVTVREVEEVSVAPAFFENI